MRKLTMLGVLVTIFSLVVAGPALADLLVELGPRDNIYDDAAVPPTATRKCLAGKDSTA
jgi:hypothetical protein